MNETESTTTLALPKVLGVDTAHCTLKDALSFNGKQSDAWVHEAIAVAGLAARGAITNASYAEAAGISTGKVSNLKAAGAAMIKMAVSGVTVTIEQGRALRLLVNKAGVKERDALVARYTSTLPAPAPGTEGVVLADVTSFDAVPGVDVAEVVGEVLALHARDRIKAAADAEAERAAGHTSPRPEASVSSVPKTEASRLHLLATVAAATKGGGILTDDMRLDLVAFGAHCVRIFAAWDLPMPEASKGAVPVVEPTPERTPEQIAEAVDALDETA